MNWNFYSVNPLRLTQHLRIQQIALQAIMRCS